MTSSGTYEVETISIIEKLRCQYEYITQRFSVKTLAVFGSASRNDLKRDSDVDILVTFDGPATFDGYFGLKYYLEDLLDRQVDLATDKMIKPRLMDRIKGDLEHVA